MGWHLLFMKLPTAGSIVGQPALCGERDSILQPVFFRSRPFFALLIAFSLICVSIASPLKAATPAVPGVPSLSVLQDWSNGGYNVQWSKWSGPDATTWTLLEDGQKYASGAAPASVNGGQTYSLHIGNRPYAAHLYQVIIANSAGSSSSVSVPYESDGASTICTFAQARSVWSHWRGTIIGGVCARR